MQRRRFLESAGASTVVVLAGLPEMGRSDALDAAIPGWRTFEVTTRVLVMEAAGVTRAWVPLPLMTDVDYQKRLGDSWKSNAADLREWRDEKYGAGALCAEWPATEPAPTLEVVSRFSTRDRRVDFASTGARAATENRDTLKAWLEPTRLIPTDGIVLSTS